MSALTEEAPRATAEAVSWLALIDGEKYGDSWQHASSTFRRAIDESGWAKKATAVRESLGKNVNRRTKSSERASTLPGAPDGEYYVMKFDSSFERKKSAVETVIAMKETDGSWRVAGYFIR